MDIAKRAITRQDNLTVDRKARRRRIKKAMEGTAGGRIRHDHFS